MTFPTMEQAARTINALIPDTALAATIAAQKMLAMAIRIPALCSPPPRAQHHRGASQQGATVVSRESE